MGSTRFSPVLDTIKKIHISAAEKIATGEMTTPVDRRFAADAEAHRRDAPRFCPACGGGLAIATEFWEAEDRRFYCSCTGCGWTGEITPTGAVAIGHEPDH